VISATAYDRHVEQLFEVLHRVTSALRGAAIEYRVIGGVAVFLHVSQRDPLAARVTRDIDLAVDRQDLPRIAQAVRQFGFEYQLSGAIDMLLDSQRPDVRSAVHLIMMKEKVRPEHLEATPEFSKAVEAEEGILPAPVRDLVRMKLVSYRLKDRVHIQDLDRAGLITPEIEADLPPQLRSRLDQIRSSE
jgi:hypothetical protein